MWMRRWFQKLMPDHWMACFYEAWSRWKMFSQKKKKTVVSFWILNTNTWTHFAFYFVPFFFFIIVPFISNQLTTYSNKYVQCIRTIALLLEYYVFICYLLGWWAHSALYSFLYNNKKWIIFLVVKRPIRTADRTIRRKNLRSIRHNQQAQQELNNRRQQHNSTRTNMKLIFMLTSIWYRF